MVAGNDFYQPSCHATVWLEKGHLLAPNNKKQKKERKKRKKKTRSPPETANHGPDSGGLEEDEGLSGFRRCVIPIRMSRLLLHSCNDKCNFFDATRNSTACNGVKISIIPFKVSNLSLSASIIILYKSRAWVSIALSTTSPWLHSPGSLQWLASNINGSSAIFSCTYIHTHIKTHHLKSNHITLDGSWDIKLTRVSMGQGSDWPRLGQNRISVSSGFKSVLQFGSWNAHPYKFV